METSLPSVVQQNVILAPFTYYKIGGPSRYFAQPETLKDLQEISQFIKTQSVPFFVLGAGSNVLINDLGFNGLIIQTGKLDRTLQHEGTTLTAGCSVTVAQILRYCTQQGLAGLEFLVGVPGNMGGVLVMNAGTKLGEATDAVLEVSVFNLKNQTTRTIAKSELTYTYRTQHFLEPEDIILKGMLKIHEQDPKIIQDTILKLLNARKATQPIDKPSCGSVFKNPDAAKGVFAWKLITDAGLRGVKRGNAQISEVHTNFIVNLGGAKASDVCELIELVKTTVQNRFGILLQEEVKIIPFSPKL